MPRVKKHDQTPDYIKQIGKLMERAGHSQNDLAEKIGATRDRVNNWMQDTAPLDADNLLKIARLYGVSTDSILDSTKPETDNPTAAAACGYTGLSVEAVENIRNLKEDVSRLLPELGIDSDSLPSGFIDAMPNVLVRFLSCYGLKTFLASLVNVGLAASAAKVAIDQNMTGPDAGEVLTRLRFAQYSSGEAAQEVAREMFHLDKWEERLRFKAAAAEMNSAERRRSNG